ncbi:hypothetical protein [Allorhodopirellula heiligendammensis]|nr:hypothetical protein [Allorhodopirellula heiligendammensis]
MWRLSVFTAVVVVPSLLNSGSVVAWERCGILPGQQVISPHGVLSHSCACSVPCKPFNSVAPILQSAPLCQPCSQTIPSLVAAEPPPGKKAVVKTREVTYTVQVPKTQLREESYTVEVPYQETRIENGRPVTTTSYRSETRTRTINEAIMVPETRVRTESYIEYEDVKLGASSFAVAEGYQGANGINVSLLRDRINEIVSHTVGEVDKSKEKLTFDTVTVAAYDPSDLETYTVTCTIDGSDVRVEVEGATTTEKLNRLSHQVSDALQPQRTESQHDVPTAQSGSRIWTHADGERQVLAHFVRKQGLSKVTLRRSKDSQQFTVDLDALSPADIAHISTLPAAPNFVATVKLLQ